jgi:hypothetical protein
LAGGNVRLDETWVVDTGKVGDRNIAARTLLKDFETFHAIALKAGSAATKTIRLRVTPGAVATGAEPEIDRQAYRLRISANEIEVTGNGEPGLFYGVQTLIQLPKRDSAGRLLVPRGTIEDWPSFQLRFLHWDAQQHQDRMETLKRYLDWTARFKANMIGFQLEDKFEFPSHPVIGIPGAYTTEQLQELVDYGLERHIQIVPLIQAPAHFSWALKHSEFAELRSDGNNYQANLCDPRTYEFIFSLYDDVIEATRGVDYLYVSTDEVYYAGIDPRCEEPYNPENRSLRWVEFVRRAHEHLTKRGRKMLIWAEYPLLPEHAKLLPPGIIDGVVGEPEYLRWEQKLGIRQLRYVSMQGVELHFPDHLSIEAEDGLSRGRLEWAYQTISFGRQWDWGGRWQGNPIGVFGAAWDASGLHNETFWLGWSAVAQYGWNPGTAPVDQHVAEFMRAYYGPRASGMIEIYRSLERQARAWQRTWDRVPSRVRGPSYGNSRGKGIGTERRDLTLAAPPLPQMPDLKIQPLFAEKYQHFLAEARSRMLENDQLILALQSAFARVDRNHYNLEVLLSLTSFIGHHWRLVLDLADAEKSLVEAQAAARKDDAAGAVRHLAGAHNTVDRLQKEIFIVFSELTTVFEKSRYRRGRSVGGRKFVNINDDSKDYWAQRRADLTYLIAPEESIGLEEWQRGLAEVIRAYARSHNVPVKGLAERHLEE